MARFPLIPIDENKDDPVLGPVIDGILERSGRVPVVYQMLLYSPQIADGFRALGGGILHGSELDRADRELAISRTAQILGGKHVFGSHSQSAIRFGVAEEKIAALANWASSDVFSERDRAILAYTDALICDGSVPDDVFAALSALLPERQVVELTASIAYYTAISKFMIAFEIGQ